MTLYDAIPLLLALSTGFLLGGIVGVWLCLTDRIKKGTQPLPKIISE